MSIPKKNPRSRGSLGRGSSRAGLGSLRRAWLAIAALGVLVASASVATAAEQAECGGAVACKCGDRVVADTVLAHNLGPCTWATSASPDELVGLRIDSNVTLDCAGFTLIGPGDAKKEEFGIKVGSTTRPVSNATVRNCNVTGFWWGIYVTTSDDIRIEDNTLIANGWKSATENGTGYGIDVASSTNVTVRGNRVIDNGNEGIHLSGSTGALVEDNVFTDNGREQVYLIDADGNTITGNETSGGRQGLEMRDSSSNQFSYNRWRGAKKHWLENDDDGNRFVYDHFEGRLAVDDSSNGNRFELCSFRNLGAECAELSAADNVFFKSRFACKKDVNTSKPLTLDRTVGADKAKKGTQLSKVFLDCNADMNEDGTVDAADVGVVQAALGSTPGSSTWNPEADLDHDGVVGPADLLVANRQLGSCVFANKPAKPVLATTVLVNNPGSAADVIRLDAAKSKDDHDAWSRFEFVVMKALSGDVIFEQALVGIPKELAQVEVSLTPGKYTAYLIAVDDFGVPSNPKRKSLSVK